MNSEGPCRQPDEPNSLLTLDMIPEAEMPAGLDIAIRDLLCVCFPADRQSFSQCRAWHDSWPAYTIVARRQDRLVGHVGMVVRAVVVGAAQVAVAGVQNFCVIPSHRGSGLSRGLLDRALLEGRHRGLGHGLLFCIPELERLYRRWGWYTVSNPFTMCDEHSQSVPLPDKNIAMAIDLAGSRFPAGPVDLLGRDW